MADLEKTIEQLKNSQETMHNGYTYLLIPPYVAYDAIKLLEEQKTMKMTVQEKIIKAIVELRDEAYILSMDLGAEEYIKRIPNECNDALIRMLEQQQKPVKPVLVAKMWECGNCHAPVGIYLDDRRDDFCRKCGKKVKWDE